MLVTMFDMVRNFSTSSWVVVGMGFALVAFVTFVFAQDTQKRSSKFLLVFAMAVVVWGFAVSFFSASVATASVGATLRALYITAGFIPLMLFLFLLVFSAEKTALTLWQRVAVFAPYVAVVALLFIPNFIVHYEQGAEGTYGKVVFGKGYILYAAYILSFLTLGFWVIIKKYRESAGIFRLQMRDLLVVLSVSVALAVFLLMVLPMPAGEHDLFWAGHASVILLTFFMGLIIIKYNFWSLKLIATEFFISVVLFTLLAELFFATSVFDLLIKVAITFLVVFSSFFLVGSVRREIQSKDKIENLLRTLDDMHARLKVLDKKKSEFLSIASQHLRDPLTAIKGYASMLMEGSFGILSEQVRQAIEKIFDSSNHLITMISDFMDISRIESGDMKYVFGDVDVRKMVLDLGVEMKQYADRARLLVDVTIDEGITREMQFVTVGDAGKLRQVFSNLIDNSIKYTPQGEVSVLLSKSPDGKKILFSVSDTGIGMNDLTKEKIFRKFSRAEGVSKVYTEGTGLGLYVAKEIVKKHEGRIWAESKGEGHGSTFYVELEGKG